MCASTILNGIIPVFLYQVVFDETLRPLSRGHRCVRPGDEGQRPRVPRGVLRVLRVRRGAVQRRLFRRPRRRRVLSTGLRAAQTPGDVRGPGADVQPPAGGRPPLANVRGAQGQAPEETQRRRRPAVPHDDDRVRRARRVQPVADTAVYVGYVFTWFALTVFYNIQGVPDIFDKCTDFCSKCS